VEVAITGDTVLVRNSKEPGGPRVIFSHEEWEAFLIGVEDGEFRISRQDEA
jgi:hypothetical protein